MVKLEACLEDEAYLEYSARPTECYSRCWLTDATGLDTLELASIDVWLFLCVGRKVNTI